MASKKKPTDSQSLSPMQKALKNAAKEQNAKNKEAGKRKSGEVRKDAGGVEEAPDYTGFLERQASGTGALLGPRKPSYRETTPSPVENTGKVASDVAVRKRDVEASLKKRAVTKTATLKETPKGRTVRKTRKTGGKAVERTENIPPSVPLTLGAVRAERAYWFGSEAGKNPSDDTKPSTVFEPTPSGGMSSYKGIKRGSFQTVPGSTETKSLERKKAQENKLAKNLRDIAAIIKQVPESVPTGDYKLRNVAMPGEEPKAGPVAELRPGRIADITNDELNKKLWKVSGALSNQGQSRGQSPGDQRVHTSNASILTSGTVGFLRTNVIGEASTVPTPEVVVQGRAKRSEARASRSPQTAEERRLQQAPVSTQIEEFANKVEASAATIPDVYDPRTQGVRFHGGMTAEDIAESPEDLEAIVSAAETKGRKKSLTVKGPRPVVGEGPTADVSPKATTIAGRVTEDLMKIKNLDIRKQRAREYAEYANSPEGFPVSRDPKKSGRFVPGSSKIVDLPSQTVSGERYSRSMTPEERAKVSEASTKEGSPRQTRRVIKKLRKSMGIPKQSGPKDELTQSEWRATKRDKASMMSDYPGRGGGDAATAAYAEMSGEAATNRNAGIIATRSASKPWVGPTGTMDLKTQTLSLEDMAKLEIENPKVASLFNRVSGKGAPYPPMNKPMMSANPASPNYDPKAQASISRSIRHNTEIEQRRQPPPGPLTEGWTPPPKTRAEKAEVKEVKARQAARSKFLERPEAEVDVAREAAKREIFVGTESEERAASPLRAALLSKMEQQTGEKVFGQVKENKQIIPRGNISIPGPDYGKMQLDVSSAAARIPTMSRVVNQIQYETGWDTRPAAQRGEPYFRSREGNQTPATVKATKVEEEATSRNRGFGGNESGYKIGRGGKQVPFKR